MTIKQLITLFLGLSLFQFVYSQREITPQLYIVKDIDGYVNMREYPSKDSRSYTKVPSKSIVSRDAERKIENGWIPVYYTQDKGYVYQDRLIPITDKKLNQKIASMMFISEELSYNNVAYILSYDIPNLYAISDKGCGMIIYDFTYDEYIFATDIPVCYQVISGDTLSLMNQGFNVDNFSAPPIGNFRPMYIWHKFYKKQNGHYGYTTEIFPEPLLVSKEKAQEIVAKAKSELKKSGGLSLLEDYSLIKQLLTAYFSGEEKEVASIMSSLPCDASYCNELEMYDHVMSSYSESKKGRE